MVVQISDGRAFDVRFAHSLHDLAKFDTNSAPGSIFQLLNNLARSMKRRFTMCSIGEVKDGQPMVALAQGFTMCAEFEQYVREQGRRYSFIRALRNTNLPRNVQAEIADVVGYDYDDLRRNYR